jgi:hypothetical protein
MEETLMEEVVVGFLGVLMPNPVGFFSLYCTQSVLYCSCERTDDGVGIRLSYHRIVSILLRMM